MKARWLRRPSSLLVASANLVAVLTLYFAVPVTTDASAERLAFNILLSVVGVGVVSVLLIREGRRMEESTGGRGGLHLVMLFELVVVLFSFTYFVMATNASSQFDGLETRIDSLYFTMSMMTTVGFGDIHASGQVARALTTANMAFNIVFLAAVGGLMRRRVQARTMAKQTSRPDQLDTRPDAP